jgi:hypothetical protein
LETTLPYDRVENPKKPNENNLLLYRNIPKEQGWILLCVIGFPSLIFLETTLPYDRVENPKKPNENNLLLYRDIPKKGWILLFKTALPFRPGGLKTK